MGVELKHALLGLLNIQPMSGYDLARAIDRSLVHFWHVDRSQVYRALARLADDGAIETETIPQTGKPDRQVHSLTERGRTELQEWLASPLPVERMKNPFLARLFFAGDLPSSEVAALLDTREQQIREFEAALHAIDAPVTDFATLIREATLRNGLVHARAELEWLRETKLRLESAKENS